MWQIADTFADQQINPPGYRMTQKESSFSRFSILIGGSCSSFLLLRCRDIVACDFSGRGANMKQPATSIYIYMYVYPLVNCHKTMEKHHFQWVNPL